MTSVRCFMQRWASPRATAAVNKRLHCVLLLSSKRSMGINAKAARSSHAFMDQMDRNKKRMPAPLRLSKQVHPEIQVSLKRAKSPREVVQIMRMYHDRRELDDCIMYNKAMQICAKHRDTRSAQQIMQMLLSSNHIEPDLVAFNIIINVMARADAPQRARQYFEIMTKRYSLRPNAITFGTLFKSLRTQSSMQEAEELLDLMVHTFGIQPDEFVYSGLLSVAAKTHHKRKGEELFNEYLIQVDQGKLRKDVTVFGGYMNIFSRCGDATGMERATRIMRTYGFKLDEVMVGDLMAGYNAARLPDKCHAIWNEYIMQNNLNVKVNDAMFKMRCVAFAHQIQQSEEWAQKFEIYEQLKHEILCVAQPKYGIAMQAYHAELLLECTIYLYGNRNPRKIVKVFECLQNEGAYIAYENRCVSNQKRAIDLHLFEPVLAQFLLRYIFAYRLAEHMDDEHGLLIIVGKGKHREGRAKNKGRLRCFVEQELSSWTPAVSAQLLPNNNGVLHVDAKQCRLFAHSERGNYAKQLLSVPCDKWYSLPQSTITSASCQN